MVMLLANWLRRAEIVMGIPAGTVMLWAAVWAEPLAAVWGPPLAAAWAEPLAAVWTEPLAAVWVMWLGTPSQ